MTRKCGDCDLCCSGILYLVKTGIDMEWDKPCIYLDNGCSIYSERPGVCEGYRCAWLKGQIPIQFKPNEINAIIELRSKKNMIAVHKTSDDVLSDELKLYLVNTALKNDAKIMSRSLSNRKWKTHYVPKKRDTG